MDDVNIKHTTEISKDAEVITLINVFTVDPQNQERLIEVLEKATEDVMQNLPGFISANIHRSVDGVRVVNYAQWKSKEAFENMLSHPDAQKHMNEASSLSRPEPHGSVETTFCSHTAVFTIFYIPLQQFILVREITHTMSKMMFMSQQEAARHISNNF